MNSSLLPILKHLLVSLDFKEAAWKCTSSYLSTKDMGFAPSVALAVISAARNKKVDEEILEAIVQ
jgi:hypothetical protein